MTSTTTAAETLETSQRPGAPPSVGWRLSVAAGMAAAVAAVPTFFIDGILTGPPAMNGSARGTALVVLVVALPTLVLALGASARGSVRARVVWLGALSYLLYNAVLFLFATPFNRLFLLYLAMLSLALWSIVTVVASTDVTALAAAVAPRLPTRAIAGYVWIIAAVNALAWLAAIRPALTAERPGSFLDGTGMTTNPIHVQDLAIWLPLAAVGAAWLWGQRPAGTLVTGTVLSLWVIESLSIAVDQWFGHQADPAASFVSASLVVPFVVAAVVGLVPLWFFLRPAAAHAVPDRRARTS